MTVALLQTRCVADSETCARNVASALARGLPDCRHQLGHPGRIALVGSAPSAGEFLDDIRSCDEVWAINGAYNWLLTRDIVPHGFIGMDPVPGLTEYVLRAQPETTFYLSSVCDPSVFDALVNHKVMLWHSKMDAMPYPDDALIIGGGTTSLTRAPYLANMMGWRDITIYGGDSSYGDGRYVYKHGTFKEDSTYPQINIEVDGSVFATELQMAHQAVQLCVMHQHFQGQLKFKCRGLMEALLKSPIMELATPVEQTKVS